MATRFLRESGCRPCPSEGSRKKWKWLPSCQVLEDSPGPDITKGGWAAALCHNRGSCAWLSRDQRLGCMGTCCCNTSKQQITPCVQVRWQVVWHIAVEKCFVCTGEFLWRSSPQQNFVTTRSCTNSIWFDFVQLVVATKSWCRDKDSHKNFPVHNTRGGTLGYFLGGYVPPGTPNWHPVLKKIALKLIPCSRKKWANFLHSVLESL